MLFVQDVRRKVARVVAAKCTLAARVDSFHESPGGEVGQGTCMLCVLSVTSVPLLGMIA